MHFSHLRFLLLVPLILLITGCAGNKEITPFSKLKTLEFTVLHTNDNHGRFWRNRHGEKGMAARKTLIDRIRSEVQDEGGHVLLLSAGDINTGVPESDIQEAKPDFIGMNLIGYDAMCIGNHEFDNPLSVLLQQEQWADFPFLAANIAYRDSGKRLFKPRLMMQLDDVRVGILGLTTEDTANLALKDNVENILFEDAVATANEWIPRMIKDDKADIVIALTHIGHYPNANYGSNAPGDVTLARDVDGIDIIVGGHSQNKLLRPDIQNSTYILQAKEWGKYVGRADFKYYYVNDFDDQGNRKGVLKMINYRLIPVNLKDERVIDGKTQWVTREEEIPEDPVVLAALKPYQEKAAKLLMKKAGELDKTMPGDRNTVRSRPTAIGSLLARAQMEKANADLAVINGGGIRTGLPAGAITEKNILEVQPFGNMISYVEMSGRDLKHYVEDLAGIESGGGFAHFAGVRLVMEGDKLVKLEVGGKPVKNDKTYRLAVNAFSAGGGDRWPEIDERPSYVDTGYTDAVALKEYIRKHSPLKFRDFEPKGEVVRK
ncbi:MAG: bifunctional UDP-sugar hydrolase/5'-nucleotidase UshA [Endozoicomonas sp.]